MRCQRSKRDSGLRKEELEWDEEDGKMIPGLKRARLTDIGEGRLWKC